ncbi:hypothetical protein PoB_005284400, partial [Plakobranchus ocellatus]
GTCADVRDTKELQIPEALLSGSAGRMIGKLMAHLTQCQTMYRLPHIWAANIFIA